MRAVTREESRAIDARALEELGLPGIVLMENAGRGAAEALLEWWRRRGLGTDPDVRILAGRGGNGGDGYVVARHLALAGLCPRVFSLVPFDTVVGDAAPMLRAARGFGLEVIEALEPEAVASALATAGEGSVLVDALLGVGFRPPLDARLAAALAPAREARERGASVVALDVPTGLDADTGEFDPSGLVADLTLTFAAPKVGFRAEGPEGEVRVVSIGTPPEWTR